MQRRIHGKLNDLPISSLTFVMTGECPRTGLRLLLFRKVFGREDVSRNLEAPAVLLVTANKRVGDRQLLCLL